VVHAPELRGWLLDMGVSAGAIVERPHPVFRPPPAAWSREEVDRRYGLTGKRALVLVGFPDPRKGFDLAVRALAGLPSDVVLVWAGGIRGPSDAREADSLRQLAEDLGVADRWRPTGYLSAPELTSVIARADVGLAPFRHLTGSGSLSRGIAAGSPIVATDLTLLRALRDAGAGLVLTPVGDVSQLRSAVRWVLDDVPAADALRAANRVFAARQSFESLATEVVTAVRRAGQAASASGSYVQADALYERASNA
jgi:glycosyltransferase involved in cell wall biosynthesis